MVKKILYPNSITGGLTYASVDERQPDSVYLNHFPGSIMVDTADFPTQCQNPEVWEIKDGVIHISIPKFKQKKKELLRAEREEYFRKLDQDFIMEFSKLSTLSNYPTPEIQAIRIHQQRLRDITDLVDVAETVDEIGNIKI